MCSWTDLWCYTHLRWMTAPTHGLGSLNWSGENFSSQHCPSVESNKTCLNCWWGRWQEIDLFLTVFFLVPVAREEPVWHVCEVLQLKALMPSNFMAPASALCHFWRVSPPRIPSWHQPLIARGRAGKVACRTGTSCLHRPLLFWLPSGREGMAAALGMPSMSLQWAGWRAASSSETSFIDHGKGEWPVHQPLSSPSAQQWPAGERRCCVAAYMSSMPRKRRKRRGF